VIAGTAVFLAWIHAHLLQLHVELARARFDALWAGLGFTGDPPAKRRRATPVSGAESASRLLIVLVIMTMQFGRINAFNEMCAGFKVK
jgi:hypothetical protein